MSSEPSILTTTVGSYPVMEWLTALPSEQARLDATRVVFDIQRQAGIDLPTDGELYRFDVNHPDTNGMIDYFVRSMAGVRSSVGRSDHEAFARMDSMRFRRKAAGVVEAEVGEGSLNLLPDCELAAGVAGGAFIVYGNQPLHAGAHIAGPALRHVRRPGDGHCGGAAPTGIGSALRVPAGG
jgi:5-methyltetrahydropteroyltriglutamate--homocysteine methyltransferase